MATSIQADRKVDVPKNYETWAWLFMRYSAVLLIPLVWIHVLINDVLVGVHAIDLTYVQQRWALAGWRTYDILLLAFTFAHGVNGLRTVTRDYLHKLSHRKLLDWGLLLLWLLISAIGAVAIIGGVRMP
jgi:succinate dehydrogenase / fumarate reductase membrane anchor subunit